jgi:hypothetical protein
MKRRDIDTLFPSRFSPSSDSSISPSAPSFLHEIVSSGLWDAFHQVVMPTLHRFEFDLFDVPVGKDRTVLDIGLAHLETLPAYDTIDHHRIGVACQDFLDRWISLLRPQLVEEIVREARLTTDPADIIMQYYDGHCWKAEEKVKQEAAKQPAKQASESKEDNEQ